MHVNLNGFNLIGGAGAPVIWANGQSQITIRNGSILQGAYGIQIVGESRHIVIEDLALDGWTVGGIRLDGGFVFAIRRNHLDGGLASGGDAIFAQASWRADGVIEDNHLRNGGGIIVSQGCVSILNNRLHDITLLPSRLGAIEHENAYGGRIAGNVIYNVSGATPNGIYLANASGIEVRDNSVTSVRNGIVVGGTGNLVLENVVQGSSDDGIRVEGQMNHVDRNLLVLSGRSGWGSGLHFVTGASNNTYGRNTARGSAGGPCLPGGGKPPTSDFCDESTGNSSFNDNYMPTLF